MDILLTTAEDISIRMALAENPAIRVINVTKTKPLAFWSSVCFSSPSANAIKIYKTNCRYINSCMIISIEISEIAELRYNI